MVQIKNKTLHRIIYIRYHDKRSCFACTFHIYIYQRDSTQAGGRDCHLGLTQGRSVLHSDVDMFSNSVFYNRQYLLLYVVDIVTTSL